MKTDTNKKVPGMKILMNKPMNTNQDYGDIKGLKLETLTRVKHGDWTPEGWPYVPVGQFHDINIAMDNIKELFPHTGKRMTKETFRNYLVNKNTQKHY